MKKPIRFLLIDDDEDDRELFEIALAEANADAAFTGSASCCDALELMKSGTLMPDYIFLDLNMPKMNGRECLAELKKSIRLSHIPVIIFSTSSDPDDRKETLNMGAVEFITKPSKTSELKQILSKFIVNHYITYNSTRA